MTRLRQLLRRVFKRDKWDRIPTVTDLKHIAQRQAKQRKTRASTFFTFPK